MLRQPLDDRMAMPTRSVYIKIVQRLTEPLLNAYYAMLKEIISSPQSRTGQDDPLPLHDHFPADNHARQHTLHSSHPLVLTAALPPLLQQEMEAMHLQPDTAIPGPSLNCARGRFPAHEYMMSDAAILTEIADGTL